jgi:hypothetical protein
MVSFRRLSKGQLPGRSYLGRWWGDTTPTYEDLVALARICLRQALMARNLETSAALFRLAHEYRRRAAEITQFPNSQFSLEPAKEAAEQWGCGDCVA